MAWQRQRTLSLTSIVEGVLARAWVCPVQNIPSAADSRSRAPVTWSPNIIAGLVQLGDPAGWLGECDSVSTATLFRPTAAPEASWDEVASLVKRAQRGDRAAFGVLAEQFQRTVYAICLRRLSNPSEALELTQEVFLHVMKRIDQLREPERFAGWIRQVAARMAINRATRRVAPPCVETEILEGAAIGEPTVGPLDTLIARERARRLYEGLERLRPIDREALVSFYIQGQSLNEIAERLDAPLGTIKRRLHTARRRLREDLMESSSDANEWTDHAESDLEAVFA